MRISKTLFEARVCNGKPRILDCLDHPNQQENYSVIMTCIHIHVSFSKPSTINRDIGTNMKLITLVSAFRHLILATQRDAQVLGHFVLY